MSKISHILLPNPVVVPTGTKLSEAAHLINKNKVPSVLVGRNGKLVGIVSIDDIISRFAYNENIDIAVDQIMHSPEITIDSDKWLSDAIIMFEQRKVSHITVVENGEKIGIIRAADILHTYLFDWTEKEEKLCASTPLNMNPSKVLRTSKSGQRTEVTASQEPCSSKMKNSPE